MYNNEEYYGIMNIAEPVKDMAIDGHILFTANLDIIITDVKLEGEKTKTCSKVYFVSFLSKLWICSSEMYNLKLSRHLFYWQHQRNKCNSTFSIIPGKNLQSINRVNIYGKAPITLAGNTLCFTDREGRDIVVHEKADEKKWKEVTQFKVRTIKDFNEKWC